MQTKARSTRYIVKAHEGEAWHTFGMNHTEGFVYDCRDFDTREEAMAHAQKAKRFYREGVIKDISDQD